MKLVIDIPKEQYITFNAKSQKEVLAVIDHNLLIKAIKNGTPLPKGHGDLIERSEALNDKGLSEFHRYDDYVKMRNYLKGIKAIIEADGGDAE